MYEIMQDLKDPISKGLLYKNLSGFCLVWTLVVLAFFCMSLEPISSVTIALMYIFQIQGINYYYEYIKLKELLCVTI